MDQKVLVVGDPHFKVSNVREARQMSDKIGELVYKEAPNLVVILGDLHNDFERIHSHVTREICYLFDKILDSLRGPDDRLIYVIGNHDCVNNQVFLSDDHAFLPYHRWQRLTIVDRTITWHPGNGARQFTFVPYVPPGRFREALDTKTGAPYLDGDWQKSTAIFCHQEFRGVQMGPIKSKDGDVWPEDAPFVVSGHIHESQWLQNNIFYAGAPADHTFGEESLKTISVFNFIDVGVEHSQIDLGLPRKRTVTVTIDEFRALEIPENTHIRAYLIGTSEELTAFKKTHEHKLIASKVKVIPKPTDTVKVKRNQEGRGYMDLLQSSVSVESPAVQEAFREVISDRQA